MADETTGQQPEERQPLPIQRARKGDKRSERPFDVPVESDFGDKDWLAAPDVKDMAERLVRKHEGIFGHYIDLDIAFLWKRKGGKANGKPKLGEAVKVGGLTTAFTDAQIVIWLAADNVYEAMLTTHQAEALVFRQLKRTGLDENGKPEIKGFDFWGFEDEVKAYGLWNSDLQGAGEAFQQLRLQIA
jgi:hypothetical protein